MTTTAADPPTIAPTSWQTPSRRRLAPKPALAWGLGLFVLGQLVLLLGMFDFCPTWRDPEYGLRLASLRQRLADHPGRPLVLVLGSSRVARGVSPTDVRATWPEWDAPVVFNAGLMGSGPVMQRLFLDRLLREGIRPDLVVVEYWPPFLGNGGDQSEMSRLDPARLDPGDVDLIATYADDPRVLRRRFREATLTPVFGHRHVLMSYFAPAWQPWYRRLDGHWCDLDDWGFQAYDSSTFGTAETRLERARVQLTPFLGQLRFSETALLAFQDTLNACRAAGIPVAVLFLPEGSAMRGWYPPGILGDIQAQLRDLVGHAQVPVFDTRTWMDDGDFLDGFHLLPDGARRFSGRLGREVLSPLLARPSHAAR